MREREEEWREVLWWRNRTHVCSFSRRSVHTARPPAAPPPTPPRSEWAESGCKDPACHHLHSTATVFCAGEAEDGLMPVSEDPEDVDTVVLDTEGADGFRLLA